MRHGGRLPDDAPDPGIERSVRARTLPVPTRTLVEQHALERIPHPSLEESISVGVRTSMAVSWSYTLWRVPGDRGDPANLVDAATLASLEGMPPAPSPAWLVDGVERMRHPMLWEAVRTSWEADPGAIHGDLLVDAVVRHVAYVAVNRFDEHRGPGARWDRPELVAPGALRAAPLVVDGVEVAGVAIDGDPHVLGLGALLDDGAILTAALPRDELDHVRIAFETVAW